MWANILLPRITMIGRREFLRNSLTSAGLVLAARASSPFAAPESKSNSVDSRIEVLMGEPLGTISPNIYGHFAENLSGVIYDGIWVGANSKVPNVDGIRKELIDEMRKIKAPVVRFPGGCFADSYDWRDGVGPADKRPRRTNFWNGGETSAAPASHSYDPNQFGTNEFAHFCKLIGSEPYLAANLRSLPAEEFFRWVEYCNSPAGSTTLADARGAGGFKDPFNVRFWGVGNESWGCGGNFTAQEYAVEFRRFTTRDPGCETPEFYSVFLRRKISAAAPRLIAHSPKANIERIFEASGGAGVGQSRTSRRRIAVLDPAIEFFGWKAPQIGCQVGLAANQFAEVREFIRAELIRVIAVAGGSSVRFSTVPEVCAARPFVGRTDTIAPVIAVPKQPPGKRTTGALILRISSMSSLRMPSTFGTLEFAPTQIPS